MSEILAIWKTSASLGRSLITVEDEESISENSPVSIFAIAKKFNLDKIVVVDSSFVNFPQLYKLSNKHNIQLIYGIEFQICNDVKDKSEDSLSTNCKVNILMRNSDGYKDLIKLHNKINGEKDNFYYESRGDYNLLLNNFTENLELIIPPHNNFLEKNLIYSGKCIPSWGKIQPIFTYHDVELPYIELVNNAIKKYSLNNKYQLNQVSPILYYKDADFKAFCCYRTINNRTKFNSPNINYLSSNSFSFESFMKKRICSVNTII